MITKKQFLDNFEQSYYYKKTKQLYDCEFISYKQYNDMNLRTIMVKKIFVPDVFYYIDMILDNPDYDVYDIGCGNNLFKEILKDKFNIVGVDKFSEADLYCYFEDFLLKKKNKIYRAFAINSLHFISFDEVEKRILQFASLFKKGGKGLITFNLARLNEASNQNKTNTIFYSIINNIITNYHDYLNLFFVEISDEKNNALDGTTKICFEVLKEVR